MTLHDTKDATIGDLSTQFYLSTSVVGTNRASACHQQLSELNTYVPVSTNTRPLTEDLLKTFRVVVLTGEEQVPISPPSNLPIYEN